MTKRAMVKVSGGSIEKTINDFLKSLLKKGVVDAILIPKELPSYDGFAQTLIRDPEKLNGVNPLSLTMPVQSARVLSNLSVKNLGKKVGAVLKSCEIRAVVELVKFLQVKLENIYLIGIDCPGTLEVADYAKLSQEKKVGGEWTKELLTGMGKGEMVFTDRYPFRTACQMCEYPMPQGADIVFELFGYPTDQEMGIEVGERLEKEMEEKEILTFTANEPSRRKEVLHKVIAERIKKRDALFEEFRGVVKDLRSFLDRFSTCIRCHNCMVACPICYCKECVFRTSVFEHEGDQFLRWADRKGGLRMPTDTLLFHLIRMSHMVTSCIGCGLCESACPSRLPVATLFRSVGEKVQKMFQYVPGRDIEETPPVAIFKEDELKMESGAI